MLYEERSKVLGIVDEYATALDARLPLGDNTLSKLDATFEKRTVIEGTLWDYAQYLGREKAIIPAVLSPG